MSGETSLKKAIRDGALIAEASILCKLVTTDITCFPLLDTPTNKQNANTSAVHGPVVAVLCRPLDLSLWDIGGARLALCLVSLAEVSTAVNVRCTFLLNSTRRHTSCRGLLLSSVIVFAIVGRLLRIWNELVRTTFNIRAGC